MAKLYRTGWNGSIPKVHGSNGKLKTCCCKCVTMGDCCTFYWQSGSGVKSMNVAAAYPNLWLAYPTIDNVAGFNSTALTEKTLALWAKGALEYYTFVGACNPISQHSIGIDGSAPTEAEIKKKLRIDASIKTYGGIGTYLASRSVQKYSGYHLISIPAISQVNGPTLLAPYIQQQKYGMDFRMFYACGVYHDDYLQWMDDYAKAVENIYSSGKQFVSWPSEMKYQGATCPEYYKHQAERMKGINSLTSNPPIFLAHNGGWALKDGISMQYAYRNPTCNYEISYSFNGTESSPYEIFPSGADYYLPDLLNSKHYNDVGQRVNTEGAVVSYTVKVGNCLELTVGFAPISVETYEWSES